MLEHFYKYSVVYVFGGAFIYFLISIYIHSWKEEKKKKLEAAEGRDKSKEVKAKNDKQDTYR